MDEFDYQYLIWLKNQIQLRFTEGDNAQLEYWLDTLERELKHLKSKSNKEYTNVTTTK